MNRSDVPDPVSLTRRQVAIAGHTGDTEVARAGFTHAEAAVRATAVGALDRLGVLDDDTLAAALVDPDPGVRRRGVTAAATRPGDRPPSLVALLDDPDATVAETAAWACGERQPPEPDIALALSRTATGHPEHLVREAAVAALGAVGDPRGLDAVLGGLGERATIRRRAVVALAAFDGPRVDDALRSALDDRDRQVRQAAEDLLGD